MKFTITSTDNSPFRDAQARQWEEHCRERAAAERLLEAEGFVRDPQRPTSWVLPEDLEPGARQP